jgi:hypothetical protein
MIRTQHLENLKINNTGSELHNHQRVIYNTVIWPGKANALSSTFVLTKFLITNC